MGINRRHIGKSNTAGLLTGVPSLFPIELKIEGQPIENGKFKIAYYPDLKKFPADCRIKALCSLAGLKKEHCPQEAKTYGDLTPDARIKFIFSLLKDREADVYVMEKFPGYYPGTAALEVQRQLDSLGSPDSLVLFLEDHKFCDLERDRMLPVYMNKENFEYHVVSGTDVKEELTVEK